MKICLAQINTTVGDLRGNRDKILRAARQAKQKGARIVVFPELTLTGYPPEDLLFKPGFIAENLKMLRSLHRASAGILLVVGFVDRDDRGRIYNAAAVLHHGRQIGCYRKVELPNYGVFDEKRYFSPGVSGLVFEAFGQKIGLSICEDIWQGDSFVYDTPYREKLSLLINLSASPYHRQKQVEREALMRRLARHTDATVLYNNLVGGQDELVFDGGSLVVSPEGRILAAAALFEEELLLVDLPARKQKKNPKPLSAEEEIYRALVLGTRDYIQKNGFKKVLVGLSGGIDSALVARIAVDALGPRNVIAVTMPSRFTAAATLRDARSQAQKLDIVCHEIPIEKPHADYLQLMSGLFRGTPSGLAEENLQARIRGNILMALSNKFGHLVLTTGNKSEFATGYCTLYGDMAGGFAVLKDVFKTWVFRLARYRNSLKPKNSILPSILKRPPTAELKKGQKDRDSLPPYGVLDAILERYVERDIPVETILREGFSREWVQKAVRLVDRNEYKRRQAPPGIKITPKAFGRDRRMPITSRYGL